MNFTTTCTAGAKDVIFGWLDFTIFALLLCVSSMIGVYFGFWGKKDDTLSEYLHGGKKMGTIPVAVSLVSGFLSGIILIGIPTEIYLYGTLEWLDMTIVVFSGILLHYFYLPIYYELQCTSIYEYLELRFNRSVRTMASILTTIYLLLYIPIVMYVPALALSQVSGINLHYIAPVISIICIIYTMLGGMKAVIWTDLIQGIIMLVVSMVFVVLGVHDVGGLDVVWQRSADGGRIRFFEMSISPFKRMTFWSVVISSPFAWTSTIAFQQSVIQKFLSLPTYNKVRTSLIIFITGIVILTSISCYTGLVIFAKYFNCDPIKSEVISRADQLMPYYVMDIAAHVPGLAGFYIAGIVSAALSTISSYLNSLGGTIYEDFVRPCLKHPISDKYANNIIKCIVVVTGLLSLANVYVTDKLGAIFQLYASFSGVTIGAIAGMFSFGMFYPRGNTKGAIAGAVCSVVIMCWIVIGNLKSRFAGALKDPVLPSSVEGCSCNSRIPVTSNSTNDTSEEDVFILYRITFLYYIPLGVIIVFIVAIIVSLLTEPPSDEKTNPVLFTPIVRKYLTRRRRRITKATEDEQVQFQLIRKYAQ